LFLKDFGRVGTGSTEAVIVNEVLDFVSVLCGRDYDYSISFVCGGYNSVVRRKFCFDCLHSIPFFACVVVGCGVAL
jgi:hypothetical protein